MFDEENLVARSAEMGDYLRARLEELRAHPTVGDVRGLGLLQAIQLVSSKSRKASFQRGSKFTSRLTDLMMERGLITRTWAVMHFAPPLVVTRDEIDRMVTIADEALTIAEGEYAADITD